MKSIVLTILTVLTAINVLGQSNNVWVKIPNYESKRELVLQSLSTLNVTNVKKAAPASRNKELQDLYQIDCNCDVNDLLVATSKLTNIFVKPEIGPKYETLYTPNDLSIYYFDYALNSINAEQAWDITKGDTSIVIAITDANYHIYHEELAGKVTYRSESNYSSDYTHGTAVAITAAGNTNNGTGKSSIGYNSRLQLRTMDYNELLEATYSGAKVINASWASGCYYNTYAQEIINEVHANGSTIIAAAGNGSTCGGSSSLVYPAAYNHVISVTSVGSNNNHERFIGNPSSTHQHNNMVDISAPGYDVVLSTAPGSYITGNGTSFAAPMVSGTVALMLSVNKCLTPDQIEYILKSSADSTIYAVNQNYVGLLGAGKLNAYKAVEMAKRFNTFDAELKISANCEISKRQATVLSINGSEPLTYKWSNGFTEPKIEIDTTDVYNVEVTDNKGCKFYSESVITKYVEINLQSDIQHVTCYNAENGYLKVDAIGGDSNYVYNWSNGATSNEITNLKPGYYTISVKDISECVKTDEFIITEPEQLTSELKYVQPTQTTFGSIDLKVYGGTKPYTYQWNHGENSEDLDYVVADFYEVLVTDNNGCMVSENIILTNEIENTASINANELGSFNMYPNPSNGNVTIDNINSDKIIITDMNGKTIEEHHNNNNGVINVNGLTTGVYFVISDTLTKKLVVR